MGCVSSAPMPKTSRHRKPPPEKEDPGTMGNNANKAADNKRGPSPNSSEQKTGNPSAPPQTAMIGAGLPPSRAEPVQKLPASRSEPVQKLPASRAEPVQKLPASQAEPVRVQQTINQVQPSAPPQPSQAPVDVGPPSLPQPAPAVLNPYVSSEFEDPPSFAHQPPPASNVSSAGYTEAEFMLSEYGIENWEEVKAKEAKEEKEAKEAKAKRRREQELRRAQKALDSAKRVANRAMKLCKHFGSGRGCRNGDSCRFSHDNPNSVRKCKHYPYCRKGQSCGFRHHEFMLVNRVWIAQEESN